MQKSIPLGTLLFVALLPACRQTADWSNEQALSAELIELQVDRNGVPREVEYHVAPTDVPQRVRDAMDALHTGGKAVGAEREYVGSTLYWELTKEIRGREVEAMFRPDGVLHSEEIEVPASDVPSAVRETVRARMDGTVTKWEEIRDAQRRLVEYHAKLTSNGLKYKLLVSIEGTLRGVVREVPAEIEVPVE